MEGIDFENTGSDFGAVFKVVNLVVAAISVKNAFQIQSALDEAIKYNENLRGLSNGDQTCFREIISRLQHNKSPRSSLAVLQQIVEAEAPKMDPEEKKQRRQLASWMKLYIERRQKSHTLPWKAELDPKYVENVLKSKMLYERAEKAVRRLAEKYSRSSTARVKSVTGTMNRLSVISTPWNKNIHVTGRRGIFLQRNSHQQYIDELNQMRNWEREWLFWLQKEQEWENLVTGKNGKDWFLPIKSYKRDLASRGREVEEKTFWHNKMHYAYFDKLKPEFDEMWLKSGNNLARMRQFMVLEQMGPFTDCVDGSLGKLMREHGFRSPTRLSKLGIE
ncbi:hypothetical protein OGATHE_004958 [Ogataea polymorpha]|uniref:Uncharacterized protein n=1 Tax=Ogataea polymorpha TaxID=460523 RepID=A0A9P8NWQ5_9ASCO|nr:hypothetical protein OGATHE_004958 [Ogataea polymorpha]